jgi:5-methyltetrahydropteroyltriglutamate--homocysteine methyltransferase
VVLCRRQEEPIVSTTLLRDAAHPQHLTDRDYVLALADALRHEYELIVEAGHILQFDAPDLALERQIMFAEP